MKRQIATLFCSGLALAGWAYPSAAAHKTPIVTGRLLISSRLAPVYSTRTFGDFDGDRFPDFAVATAAAPRGVSYRFRVAVYLSTFPDTTFDVETAVPGGLHVDTRDVDGDNDLDLVISTQFGRQAVGVWINDGSGVFSPADRTAYPGALWHFGDRFLQSPERPPGRTSPFNVSTGSAIEPVGCALTTRVIEFQKWPPTDTRLSLFAYLFRPLRAPPLI